MSKEARKIREKTILKTCFEALKAHREFSQDLHKRLSQYQKHRDLCRTISTWNTLRAEYKFKIAEKQSKNHYKQLLFKRTFKMFTLYKTSKEYNDSVYHHADVYRTAILLKTAFECLRNHCLEEQYQRELTTTADLFRMKKMMRRWRRAYLNINVAKASFEYNAQSFEVEAPTITDLLAYTKHERSRVYKNMECESPQILKKTEAKGKGYRSMLHEALKENMQIN